MKFKTRLTALLTAAVMLTAMLPAALAAGEDDPGYLDVAQDAWYYDAVYFAVDRDLMGGYSDESFGPADTLKRSMLAQVFYNWEQQPYSGEGEEKPWAGTAPFADVKAGAWYENAVNWARSEKVMQGDGSSFNPDRDLNRQEMAVALYGFAGYKGVDRAADADLSAYADGGNVASWAREAVEWAVTNQMFHIENNALTPAAPVQRANDTAKANGYTPIGQVGQGSKVYAQMHTWEDGVALSALGEDGTFRIGTMAAEQGMNRRFAQTNVIWNGDGWDHWRVYSVSEQDYYEENGEQHPCFDIVLIPA